MTNRPLETATIIFSYFIIIIIIIIIIVIFFCRKKDPWLRDYLIVAMTMLTNRSFYHFNGDGHFLLQKSKKNIFCI